MGWGGCDCGWEVVVAETFVVWVEVGGRLWVGLWLFVGGRLWQSVGWLEVHFYDKLSHAWIGWVEVHTHDTIPMTKYP